jgi:hypothetical protein
VVGIGLGIPLAVAYVNNDLILTIANLAQDHLAVTGLALVITGAQLFVFVLLLQGAAVATARRDFGDIPRFSRTGAADR